MEAIRNFLEQFDLTLTADNMGTSLSIMGQGMLGIFIVIAAIAGVTIALNSVTSAKKDDNKDEE
jgi:hypothetical protein